jgi:hypothetical protein
MLPKARIGMSMAGFARPILPPNFCSCGLDWTAAPPLVFVAPRTWIESRFGKDSCWLARLGQPVVFGRALDHLLDVNIHLPEKHRGNRVTVAFVSQNGHVLLQA